ncbi:MAG: HEAT repeat domain-containing protein [Thermodesulfobacteriota bacterium]|nr:HEAT repeat domain-containing protein [Thermodesulfobacteriota bacterium]
MTLKPTPVLDKKKVEGIPEGLPPEEVERLQKLQVKLADFVLHLIQAFLRTGYYTPDHPESKKAKEGLYQRFRELFREEEDELAFLVREEQERQEIFVEGVLPEAQKLGRMMMKGMGELYVPKFAKYMERKDLISLTLKSRMSQKEFGTFVDVMSEPSLVDTRRKQDQDRFAQVLYSREIFNISYIFNEEFLALEREMPWRARLTLSRMRKDLKMIPLFQKMLGQEIHEIRKNLLRDALRPIRQSDLLCAILRNSDLVSTSGSLEETIEDEIVSSLKKQYLLNTSRIFLREHLDLKKLQKEDAFERKSDRLVKKISFRLKEAGTRETENLLEEFFRHQLIRLEDLSPELKDKMLLERLTDKFLNYTDQFFLQLDQAKDKEAFLTVALSFVRMIPELIRRDRYPEVLRIFETMRHHFHQKKMWALLAGQILEEIGKGAIPQLLKEKFLKGKKEVRVAIIPTFAALEIGAVPVLLDILKTSEDQWVRKNACEALIQIGPVAAIHLLKELEQRQTSVETTCDILRVLGEIKSREWQAPLTNLSKSFTIHEHSKLREQAIHTLCQVGGSEGEETFLSSLDDPDFEVRKRAVWCLGMIKSARGIGKMVGMLKELSATSTPQSDKLETQIYLAFGLSGNITIEGKTSEEILFEVLEKRGIKGLLGFLQKNTLSDASLLAICDTLGKIGTRESIKMLTRLEKSQKGPLIPKIGEAIKKIEDRMQK